MHADPTISGTKKESSITLLRKLAHQSESALTRCQIAEIEAVDVLQKCAGKLAPRANRAKLSEVRVVDNVEVGRLLKEDTLRKKKSYEKPKQRPQELNKRPIRLPREVANKVVGGVRGVGGLLWQRYGPWIDHKLSLANLPAAVCYHRHFWR